MIANASLPGLKARGIELWAEGEKLRYRAPVAAITADVLAALKANKPALMAELRRRQLAVVEGGNATEYLAERSAICAADGLPPATLRPVFRCILRGNPPFILLGRVGESLEQARAELLTQFGDDFQNVCMHQTNGIGLRVSKP